MKARIEWHARPPVEARGWCPCGATWFSSAPAHCAECHQTFATDADFDRHQTTARRDSKTHRQGDVTCKTMPATRIAAPPQTRRSVSRLPSLTGVGRH